LAEAEVVAARVNAELHQGFRTCLGFQPAAPREFLARWLEHHEYVLRSSAHTIRRYRSAAGRLVGFLESSGIRTLDRITPETAQAYVRELRTRPVSPNGHPHTAKRWMRDKTVRFNLEVARAFLNRARKERHLPPYSENPFSELRFDGMRIDNAKPIQPLSTEEEILFWKHCDAWAGRAFCVLAYTGMRPGELRTLMIHDLDFEHGLIHVRSKPEFHFTTKTRNARLLPMTEEIRSALCQAISARTAGPVFQRRGFPHRGVTVISGRSLAELQRAFGQFMAGERMLAEQGRPWSREAEARAANRGWYRMGALRVEDNRREFIRIMRRAGLEGRTCVKDFRHTWATTLQVARVDPFARRDMLGHTGLLMTGHYTHTSPEVLNTEVQRAREVRPGAILALRDRLRCP
jgi:integrase